MCWVRQRVGSVAGVFMPLCHDCSAAFEFAILSAANMRAPHIRVNDKLPGLIGRLTQAYIRKHVMKVLKFRLPPWFSHHASVLSEAAELESLGDARDDNKGRFARSWRQLLEVLFWVMAIYP